MHSTDAVESPQFSQFRTKEDAVKRLSEVLNDPIVKHALGIIQGLSQPSCLPDPQPGVHHDTTVTHHMHFLMGINAAVRKLQKLATPLKVQEANPEREEFEDHAEDLQPFDLSPKN